MSAVAKDIAEKATRISAEMRVPFPGSRKIYVNGSRPDLRVPMREISVSPTRTERGLEDNAPVTVYDTSGPYTDPDAHIDLLRGLPPLRAAWIEERGDTEQLDGQSQAFSDCRRRLAPVDGDGEIQTPAPGQGRRQRHADALCAARHHHPGDGVRRHPRERPP